MEPPLAHARLSPRRNTLPQQILDMCKLSFETKCCHHRALQVLQGSSSVLLALTISGL